MISRQEGLREGTIASVMFHKFEFQHLFACTPVEFSVGAVAILNGGRISWSTLTKLSLRYKERCPSNLIDQICFISALRSVGCVRGTQGCLFAIGL